MKDIAKTLGKKDWDFSVDPCSGQRNWTSSGQAKGLINAVTCDCSFANGTVCHVVSMYVSELPLCVCMFVESVILSVQQFSRHY